MAGRMSLVGMLVDVLLTLVQIIVFLYDVLSYPVYKFFSKAMAKVISVNFLDKDEIES